MEEMINEVGTDAVETVAEVAKDHGALKEAGKYGIAAAAGAGLTILGQKIFKKAKEKRAARKLKKAANEAVSKVDQICEEINESLKD